MYDVRRRGAAFLRVDGKGQPRLGHICQTIVVPERDRSGRTRSGIELDTQIRHSRIDYKCD